MIKPSKERVRRSFDRAAASYDSAAFVQRAICERLAATLPAAGAPDRILDAGCGTGYAIPLLRKRYPLAAALALDIAPAMLARVSDHNLRLAGDIEHLPVADDSIDLYWSSLTVQWCDLPRLLAEARRVLAPAGELRLATLGPGTFHELRDAFAGVDAYRHTLAFHNAGEILEMAAAAGLESAVASSAGEVAHYPDFRTLLRAVKAIGANQLGAGRRTGLMSRAALSRAEAAYEARRTSRGLPLTYDVILLSARK
jgi:malonyl-CoA O-methyltransferase